MEGCGGEHLVGMRLSGVSRVAWREITHVEETCVTETDNERERNLPSC